MKHLLIAASVAALATAFENDTCDVVLVKGPNGPLRVNKDDYEADREKPAKDRQWGALHDDDDNADLQQVPQSPAQAPDAPALAAPSAPNFSGGDNSQTVPLPIDPLKQAAAPLNHGENARLVMPKKIKGKQRYFVVDGTGQDIKMDGIEPDGYETEEAAWTAIRALPH